MAPLGLRTPYTIRADDLAEVLCHRKVGEAEEYLVRWRPSTPTPPPPSTPTPPPPSARPSTPPPPSTPTPPPPSARPSTPPPPPSARPLTPSPPSAPCSWHVLPELYRCLHHVQTYIETAQSTWTLSTTNPAFALPANRKRKSPEAGADLSGLLTPGTDRSLSPPAPSIAPEPPGPTVYNAVLERKEGYIVAKQPLDWQARGDIAHVDCYTLPTTAMIEVAKKTPVSQAESAIRHKFMHMLRNVKAVQLENKVDTTTPSLDFTFINKYVLREGVYAHPPETFEGCVKRCKPDMGQNIGCEYTALCECLEYAAVDEQRLQKKDNDLYQQYTSAKRAGLAFDTTGMPKRFPYKKANVGDSKRPQTLQSFYREERHPIYECNDNCKCGPICKSRVVQKGRKVPLTVFKTPTRGWGVHCNEDLVQGEFIDTYLGEVITSEEADKREGKFGKEKDSYLYALDKFVSDPLDGTQDLTHAMCYVVDGQYMGNATRFINHSCEPNCRQYTVSYNKNDFRLYNLAFFAYEDIPAGTELTFDYQDKDEVEVNDAIQRREQAERDFADNKDMIRCNCGALKCRGFLWTTDP